MFVVNDYPPPLPADLVEQMKNVETATLGHLLHDGFLDRHIRSISSGLRVVGCAVTVRIPAMDSVLLHHAVSHARPGDFVVVDRCGDDRHACWGGIVTHAAAIGKVAGAAIDGPCTDLSEIQRCNFPIWARGFSPITTKQLGLGGALNVPITVGGQIVHPGDLVLADESGVVVLARERAASLAAKALAMQSFEIDLVEKLRSGFRLSDLSGATSKVMDATVRQADAGH